MYEEDIELEKQIPHEAKVVLECNPDLRDQANLIVKELSKSNNTIFSTKEIKERLPNKYKPFTNLIIYQMVLTKNALKKNSKEWYFFKDEDVDRFYKTLSLTNRMKEILQ